ncbi:1,4-dihydroxy-2-naphthoate octaprenyltransferase [Candidatus Thorarchaeota archaeon]|nr:MAG: 1,4-dihydroxy-2-naphthoate octaprenyltransferase [Candidatus Thorarchaeota archaeon]
MTGKAVDVRSKILAWKAQLRAPFLTASGLPIILGTSVALALHGIVLWDVFFLAIVAGLCLHLGANSTNDYFDHTEEGSGSDDINVNLVRPFTGGSRMLQKGVLLPKEVLAGSLLFFMVGSLIGLYLVYSRGLFILVLGLIGAGSGFFYSAPPFRFVNRGIGELVIGLNFGVLTTFGGYYVQTLDFNPEPIFASIPLATLIAGILFINEFPDYNADKGAGKRTLVVRLGRKKASRFYAILMVFLYTYTLIAGFLQLISITSLITFSTLPIAVFATRHTLQNYESPQDISPANASAVVLHLLFGIGLSIAYVLDYFRLGFLWIMLFSVVFLLSSSIFVWCISKSNHNTG